MPSITRRDFHNGTALTIAAGLTPAAQLAAQPARYPPALIGLRGQHVGSLEIAQALAREGQKKNNNKKPNDEHNKQNKNNTRNNKQTAAWFFRRANPSARVLI